MVTETPRSLGYRMPAEWEPHTATWLAWPHNAEDWPGRFHPIPWVYCDIVRHLSRVEDVHLLVQDKSAAQRARGMLARTGAELGRVHFHQWPTDRVWLRDSGPIFVARPGGEVAITNWRFNAWAKYQDWQLDDQRVERGQRGLQVVGAAFGEAEMFARHRGAAAVRGGQPAAIELGSANPDRGHDHAQPGHRAGQGCDHQAVVADGFADGLLEHREHELVLAGEIIVEGAAGEAGAGEDGADRQPFEPGLVEQFVSGLDHAPGPRIAVAGGEPHRRVWDRKGRAGHGGMD